ncbi:NADP-dependent 3-hydroxy acid dehydrogenase YdfG [Faunimonas pinastri]|uniref:NADP-dependent 3-hydroxy acid dehydrogenase YdfG n=1 Tax=Faunimonas pinastri TaxID=1855383 RepID=A0A1H9Q4L2_9HYPH|nr:SDR family oxidoreductase [Faunimonas pinastri]SER55384.1 NADP-dependent 3-hydroxy acid dehydrogenase YdfG [Faunimonas pinastri]
MSKTVLITGASSGFGQMTAYVLAEAGHTVYASMRDTKGRNAEKVAAAARHATEQGIDLRTVELDVQDEGSVERAVQTVIDEAGNLDVLIHNAGHMVLGPAEAFTPEQYAQQYDVNVISTQRVNRAALPHMRAARSGLLVWISSTSVRGGTPPYLAPYFAAKAAMESLAISYAGEVALWGIDTSIVAPGVFGTGTNHFQNSGHPNDAAVAQTYATGPTADLQDRVAKGHAAMEPDDSDPQEVARAIVRLVDLPAGKRPFHVTVDPADMGYEVMAAMSDRIRGEIMTAMSLKDILKPASA